MGVGSTGCSVLATCILLGLAEDQAIYSSALNQLLEGIFGGKVSLQPEERMLRTTVDGLAYLLVFVCF